MLSDFWVKHPRAAQPLKAWYAEARQAAWRRPQDIKQQYRSASFIADSRVVFNIAGNLYRLVAAVHYSSGIVFIRFVGTHAEYDRIDAGTV
jgi:mRNA interferase HigB